MNAKPFLTASFLIVAVASASDMADSLAPYRIRAVSCTVQEMILLSSGEPIPLPATALSRDRIRRIYIREGDFIDGFLVSGVDKARGRVVLTKNGTNVTIVSIPSGIQTSYWADVVSTQSNTVWRVKVGDRLEGEWTISAISESGGVTATNKTGLAVAIEREGN